MATAAQIQANQKNSTGSTGPVTPEGKDASRRNSLRHGLAGSGGVVRAEDRAKVEVRASAFRDEFRPGSEFERTLVEQMAVDSVRMDRCREAYLTLLEDHADRAALCWDEDRRAEAEELAARLGRDPARTRSKLEQSRHGCELLIGRWEGLGRILRDVDSWDDAQRTMALDLLGVPLELRAGTTAVDLAEGEAAEVKAFRLGVVEAELARLRRRKSQAFELLDDHDRESAEAGIGAELSKPLKLLQRYESACWRRLQVAIRHFKDRDRQDEPVAPRAAAGRPPAAPSSWPGGGDPFKLPDLPAGSESWTVDEIIDFYCGKAPAPVAAGPVPPTIAVPPDRRT